MPVIGGTVTINRDADSHVMLSKKLAELFVKHDAIRVNPQIEPAYAVKGRLNFRDDPPQSRPAYQQRLPTMQNHLHSFEPVRGRVLGDPLRRPRDHCI